MARLLFQPYIQVLAMKLWMAIGFLTRWADGVRPVDRALQETIEHREEDTRTLRSSLGLRQQDLDAEVSVETVCAGMDAIKSDPAKVRRDAREHLAAIRQLN